MEALDRAMQFSDTEKDFSAYSKVSSKDRKDAFGRHNVGVGKKSINPKISAIAFLWFIQPTVTVWSYENFNFIPQKVHAYQWNIYCSGIAV